MTAGISVKRTFFGRPKPTDEQVGWAAGFCDAASQPHSLSDGEAFAFLCVAFEQAFEGSGKKCATSFLNNQDRYWPHMQAGGQAYLDWMNGDKPPIMPFH